MSDSESHNEYEMCPVFNGEKEDLDRFLYDMDYMVDMIWIGEN